MLTRPLPQPPTDGVANPLKATVCGRGPASYFDWLALLKRPDVVLVHTGQMHFRAEITDATPCYLFCGKLKFHRRHGWQVQRQSQRVYRMRYRLVRNVTETFT